MKPEDLAIIEPNLEIPTSVTNIYFKQKDSAKKDLKKDLLTHTIIKWG